MHASTLALLVRHLNTVASHAQTNKMPLKNLAILFSPTTEISQDLLMCLAANATELFAGYVAEHHVVERHVAEHMPIQSVQLLE